MEIIDNKTRKMGDVIKNVMPFAQNLYFRTGYFFFSGYKEIYKELKDKNVKILVGKDVQKGLGGVISEIDYPNIENRPKTIVRKDYFSSLVNIFSESNEVDTKDTAEAYQVFKSKILDGSLEIRKTLEPDHSKVYIFENSPAHNQNGEYLGVVIKGSSNLTFSGLKGQNEDNELFKDNDYFRTYKQKFDELWETSVKLVDSENIRDFEKEVIEKIWVDQDHLPSPYSVYLRVLFEYFALTDDKSILTPAEITKEKINLRYQVDAIRDALNIISKHNGVIIADVVGLGKSIIASCIAKNLDIKTIIISPPHLIPQWEDYRYEFRFDAKVYGAGSVLKAIEENKSDEQKLIIIDEAHKFRNEEKSLYANLHKLCTGNKVILLTATPFNNNPKDIFSLIKLFQIPAKSTIQTVDNLSLRFKELMKEYNRIKKIKKKDVSEQQIKSEINNLALQIKDLLAPLLIRRSRVDLQNIDVYKKDLDVQNVYFPEVVPPTSIEYDFGEMEDLYIHTLNLIAPGDLESGFRGARYNVISYLVNKEKRVEIAAKLNIDPNLIENTQRYLAKFMKRLLVHRFESSFYAFETSLNKMIESYMKVIGWYEKGKVPIYKKGDLPDIDEIIGDYDEDSQKRLDEFYEVYSEKGVELVDAKDLNDEYIVHLREDLAILHQIGDLWKGFNPRKDPKVHILREKIIQALTENRNRKIIVFSVYSDTVKYLYEQLKDNFRVFKYSAEDSSSTNKEIIRSNFDAGYSNQKDDYDLLLATDAISEGYNLHRAGIIFNYDIPYNPTRVIQRVGRINRVNKKVFEKLYIYNFFPSPTGEEETGIKRIATLKIDMIKALLGDDTKYLTADEIIKTYNDELKKEIDNAEDASWDYKYKNIVLSLQNSVEMERAFQIPMRAKIRRNIDSDLEKDKIVVFGRKGSDYAFRVGLSTSETVSITAPEAIKLFEAEKSEKSFQVSNKFFDIYEHAKNNLFVRKSEVPKDKGVVEALEKVNLLKEIKPDLKDYFDDLEFVIKELGALPAKFAKTIRSIRKEHLDDDLGMLLSEVPHIYLIRKIQEAESVEEGEESLILAEEF